jgi:hypothetical protein
VDRKREGLSGNMHGEGGSYVEKIKGEFAMGLGGKKGKKKMRDVGRTKELSNNDISRFYLMLILCIY